MYTNETQKIERFKQMLNGYFGLLQAWAEIPSIAAQLKGLLDTTTFKTLKEYFNKIEEVFSYANSPEQLKPSRNFNVAGAALGSKAVWGRSAPNPLTLEDIFTLIHQNLLIIQGILATQTELAHIAIPETVQILKEEANKIIVYDGPRTNKANLVGISFTGNKLIYYYNLPQRNHSSTFQIIYDLQNKKASLAVQFLGEARGRWQQLGSLVYILTELNGIPVEKTVEVDQLKGILSFAWQINTPKQAAFAFAYVANMADFATNNIPLFSVHPEQKNLLGLIATQNNIKTDDIIDIIFKLFPTHPDLLYYINEITINEITYRLGTSNPLTDRAFELLIQSFPTASIPIKNKIFDMLSQDFTSLSKKINEEIFTLIKNIYNRPEELTIFREKTAQLLDTISPALNPNEIFSFIENNLILADNPNEQALGIKLLIKLLNPSAPNNTSFIHFTHNALTQSLDSQDPVIFGLGLQLAAALIKIDETKIEPILEQAQAKSTEPAIVMKNLLEPLAENTKLVELITSYALAHMKTENFEQKEAALNLLSALFRYNTIPLTNDIIEALEQAATAPIKNEVIIQQLIIRILTQASEQEEWQDPVVINRLARVVYNAKSVPDEWLLSFITTNILNNKNTQLLLAFFDLLAHEQPYKPRRGIVEFMLLPLGWGSRGGPDDLIAQLDSPEDLQRFKTFLVRFRNSRLGKYYKNETNTYIKMIDQKLGISENFFSRIYNALFGY